MRFWEYCYVLKIKEVNLKTIKCMNQNIKQKKKKIIILVLIDPALVDIL